MLLDRFFTKRRAVSGILSEDQIEAALSGETEEALSAPAIPEDERISIEAEVIRRIRKLMPDLHSAATTEMRDRALTVLEALANDKLPYIRQIVAETIKDSSRVPHRVVDKLARDVELVTCAPILEYSPLLSDDDLKEIIASTQVEGAIAAISRRRQVTKDVSDAVAATMDVSGVAGLLANENAKIRKETLEKIVDGAKHVEEWHEPLVFRPELSKRAMKRIAGFVASSLVHVMVSHHKLDSDFADMLLGMVRARLDEDQDEADIAEKARHLVEWGCVDDAYLGDLIDHRQTSLVVHVLAGSAEIAHDVAEKIVASASAKAIIALVCKAGFSMRTALRVQYDVAHIRGDDVIHPKDGTDCPLSQGEISWQLSYFSNL